MKSARGEVLYVGKAINLNARVRSYFVQAPSDTRPFVALLDRVLADLEVVVVHSEKEALLLESELIKKHQPKYNILLRDGKSYLHLRIDLHQEFPRVEVVRNLEEDGATYFGPYDSATDIREVVRMIRRYFQLRVCTDRTLATRKRPCLIHQMGRCLAPCVYEVPAEEYRQHVDAVMLLLKGRSKQLVDFLKKRMKQYSEELKFEEAARVRDQLGALGRSQEKQAVVFNNTDDRDFLGFAQNSHKLSIYILQLRQGRLDGGRSFCFKQQGIPLEEVFSSFLNLYYAAESFIPSHILLPMQLQEDTEALVTLLREKKNAKVEIHTPSRGKWRSLLQTAQENASNNLQEHEHEEEDTQKLLAQLQQKLFLKKFPRWVECFDISHSQGKSIVASKVAAVEGKLEKGRYRRFHLKTVDANDDFRSLYEILFRRLKRGEEEGAFPDLIVIDGGKGQLSAAMAAARDLRIAEEIDWVGLAKGRLLRQALPAEASTHSEERLFLPGRKEALLLPQNAPELLFLARLRDEAHRFALAFQRKTARKQLLRTRLDEIPGIGSARKRCLLQHFGSHKRLKEASCAEIAEVCGIGEALAAKLFDSLHKPKEEKEPLGT
ncbi:MAG: excinuclease ABC subunit UvrC [Proteobacteria bacterium]|nr:excinuclease ABC subunit UvrC [Cystobacterineae bacterium]MCL2314239.1 excinuclease ABC subunit UvrC [Pseudomonadota bacterium]